MNKLKDYWRRWCLCYRENGLKYTVKKTFKRIVERHQRKKAEKVSLQNGNTLSSVQNNNKSNNNNTPHIETISEELNLSKQQINVGFFHSGGLGDLIVLANYLYKFRIKYGYENLRIDVFAKNSFNSAKVIFYDGYVIDNLYNKSDYEKIFREYDLFVQITRYPDIRKRNDKKIASMMPELFEYISLCERFRSENPRFYTNPGITDGQGAVLSIINGKKRIHQPDVYGFLGVQEKYEYDIPIMEDEYDYLNDIDLNGHKFITINRGVDTNQTKDSIKLWPFIYYNLLIKMLKSKYPDIVLVQLGSSRDRCESFQGIDLDLVGKTNLEQVKVLLKHALVHIDNEGGMVHLRHALGGGKSVVLFGPTSSEFFGYSENENVVGDGCATWCEWAMRDWQKSCLRGYRNAPCMVSITPERVMQSVEKIVEEQVIDE